MIILCTCFSRFMSKRKSKVYERTISYADRQCRGTHIVITITHGLILFQRIPDTLPDTLVIIFRVRDSLFGINTRDKYGAVLNATKRSPRHVWTNVRWRLEMYRYDANCDSRNIETIETAI